MLEKELFFPTPIYFFDVAGSAELNQYLKTRIYSWRDRDQTGIVRSNARDTGAWHSPTTMAELPEYALFVEQVDDVFQQIHTDQKYSTRHRPACQNMWANVNPGGGYNRSHTHPGSLWSGVYYVQAPPECGRVVFQDPRVQAQVILPFTEQATNLSVEQWSEVYHQPIEGRLILFPSWLRHEVESNRSALNSPVGDRISISFNYGQISKD